MIARPINPSDLIPIRGAYRHRIPLPCIPGYEGVGSVIAIGSSVQKSMLGKHVLPLRGEGTWQQYVKASSSLSIEIPPFIPDDEASRSYINPLTAWILCKELLGRSPDSFLLVNAFSSAIGPMFAQLSAVFGYRLIAVVRSSDSWKRLATELDLRSKLFHLRHWIQGISVEDWQNSFLNIFALLRQKQLCLGNIEARYPLAKIAKAVQAAERPGRQGKLLLT
ncbi:zinc-dependent alcohol dehydrogenase family protein [Paenibacillus sp. D9]|uniref:zinc-dependent alcohol dehydrogenase family protein n=2 Tax=Paenibacillus TaxID=44249 RepID=UPI001E4E12C2|nr:zinc-dependent alcohol dehydrogenase family protein [Paenibacillus sp. D9]